jgi:excisionase family DNA binding protein
LTIIDELLAEHTHDEAVAILNARGLTGGWRTPFTVASLTALCKAHGIPALRERLRAQGMLTVEETARQLGVSTDTVATWRRQGLLTARRVDGRRSHLYHPGQGRPPLHHKTEAADRRADGLLSANQLAAQLGVSSSTVTRWHRLGLITAVPVEHHGVLYPDGQRRPTPAQIIAAGRPLAYRHQQLITGGQLATRLHVARSTIYKWYRLGLIEAVAADYRGRHLYRPDQQPPDPAEITTARTAASTATATTRPRKCQTRPARYDQRKRRNPPPTRQTAGTPARGAV